MVLGEGFGNPTFGSPPCAALATVPPVAVLVVPWTVTHAPPVASHKRLDASRDAVTISPRQTRGPGASVGRFALDLDTEKP